MMPDRLIIALVALLALSACSNMLTSDTDVDARTATVQKFDLDDLDADGVINARDRCAETLLGSLVDNDGCPSNAIAQSFQELIVFFANDSTEIRADQLAAIKETAAFMQRYPSTTLVLEGHASSPGNIEYNRNLSQRRAEAVKASLAGQGVAKERLEIVAWGESKPEIEREDAQSYAVNRSVVGELKASDRSTTMKWTIYTPELNKR